METNKMLWSVTIPTYNAAAYLEETLNSVLSQDLGADKMEIIVVDNRSTDDTIEIAKRVGNGRVKTVINKYNVGPHGNFNRCIEVSKGELLHILHADDLVKPGFYDRLERAFTQHPDVHLVCCKCESIENGKINYIYPTISSLLSPSNDISAFIGGNPIPTPSVVVKRKAYELVGGFDEKFTHMADWDMWPRIISKLKGLYIEDKLALYRTHPLNHTAELKARGSNVLDYEILFNKFIQLGYPISKSEAATRLRRLAIDNYTTYFYAGNKVASANMLDLLKRYASPLDIFIVLTKVKARRMLGIIKRDVLHLN